MRGRRPEKILAGVSHRIRNKRKLAPEGCKKAHEFNPPQPAFSHYIRHEKPRTLIASTWRPRLHAYMGGSLSTFETVPEIVGGVEDHVHILLGLRRVESLSDVMCKLKSNSSRWVHDEIGVKMFAWQEGYGAFTVGASQREAVRRYIANQEEHHKKRTFREEYLEFLQKSGVDFDPHYL